MSRGKSSLSKPLEMIINFFTKPKKDSNPWKNDLEELAQKYAEQQPLPEVNEPTAKETAQSQLSVLSPTSEQTGQKLKKLIDVVSEAKRDAEAKEARAQEALANGTQAHKEAQAQLESATEETDRIVVRPIKKNRVGDATTPDMKAWWGQSVATWDPIDEKNLDSVEQIRPRRSTRWFD